MMAGHGNLPQEGLMLKPKMLLGGKYLFKNTYILSSRSNMKVKSPRTWRMVRHPRLQVLGSCPSHALVRRTLDFNYRMALQKNQLTDAFRERYPTIPELSIEDSVRHMANINLMNPGGKANMLRLTIRDLMHRGVTTERVIPYGGIMGTEEGIPESERGTFLAGDIVYDFCDIGNREQIQALIDLLNRNGSFVAGYTARTSHQYLQSGEILGRKGSIMPTATNRTATHVVQVTGHCGEWSVEEKKWKGFWRFVNSWGPSWMDKGSGLMDFALIDYFLKVELPRDILKAA